MKKPLILLVDDNSKNLQVFEGVKLIAKKIKGPSIFGLARTLKGDIKAAWDAVKYSSKPGIHTFIATCH